MVVVTSILNPARTPEGKISQNSVLSSPPRSPSYSHYSPDHDRHADSPPLPDGPNALSNSSSSAQCVPADSQQNVNVSAVPVPFPPRRPKIPHNRSTMVPVRRYVQKTPFMIYDLARVRALWVHEEQTMQHFHGTPAQPAKDCEQELKHNCRHCHPPPHFFSCNEQIYTANGKRYNGYTDQGRGFFTSADEFMDLPDVEAVGVPDDMECEFDDDADSHGQIGDDMMALDSNNSSAHMDAFPVVISTCE